MSLIKFGNSFISYGNNLLDFDASYIPEPEPEPDPNTAIIGGRSYRVVDMPDGNTWLAENLDYKFEVDGSPIPIGVPYDSQSTSPSAWYYNNDEAMYGLDGERKCGLLYNWYAVKYLNDNKDTLIPGWHVPTKSEWDNLVNAASLDAVGTELKALDTDWYMGWNGTDDYGFSMLPTGEYYGSFAYLGSQAYFWTSTNSESMNAHGKIFRKSESYTTYFTDRKTHGSSLRLVKDK